ncbi:CUE domain-containing protein 3 [Vanrija pseudolonga]|uniref:CUE domain-containing protein 3 n=1 Tax=Vanrija pseudolonga TaxID=143232 RepID=A0AAF0Y039_9TREE|nr:CUE domain-containing protein 3 [Vanrija pseudolonga]
MTAALPTEPPPHELAERALPYLVSAVSRAAPNGPSALLPPLSLALSTLARARLAGQRLSSPLAPLHAFVSLATEDPAAVPLSLAYDALLAYPADSAALSPALDAVLSAHLDETATLVPALTRRLSSASKPLELLAPARLAHALLRASDALAALLLEHADDLVPAISAAYARLGGGRDDVRAKSEALLLVRAIAGLMGRGAASAALVRLMGDAGVKGTALVNQSLRDDYALFTTGDVDADVRAVLKALQDDERADDPRIAPLQDVFPTLPAHLLVDALHHPAFAASGSSARTPKEQAAPLIDAILGSALPPELGELAAAVRAAGAGRAADAREKVERRNIWNEELDLSRMRLKGQTDPVVGKEIPDNLRASILRLVDQQAEEAEEAARAVAEARGLGLAPKPRRLYLGDDEDDIDSDVGPTVRLAADGEESGDESDDGEHLDGALDGRPAGNDVQLHLELAYIRNPAVFGRDAATRRSAARKELRDATGYDDGQLEGWKIMLDRNPHKEAILERHQFSREPAKDKPKPKKDKAGGGGSGPNDSGSNASGSTRGGGRGGRGGRGGNKGSRGHSNAARTRGHDKKMTRMGAGL